MNSVLLRLRSLKKRYNEGAIMSDKKNHVPSECSECRGMGWIWYPDVNEYLELISRREKCGVCGGTGLVEQKAQRRDKVRS